MVNKLGNMLFLGNKETHGLNWFILGLLVWWSGLAGRDLYLVPVLVGILIMAYNVFRANSFKNIFGNSETIKAWATNGTLLWLLVLQGIVLTVTAVFKLYSFQWNIWDVGIYSDIIFNTSKGNFYSSYNLAHNWGDHFTPSMSVLSIFYWIYPSSHWMTLSKVLALIISPILIWKICGNVFVEKKQVYYVGLTLSLFWLFFYAPIVNSSYFAFHPSSLAAPAILYSFLCLQKKEWWKLILIFMFLIGLKEHLASVLIGFGLYMILNTQQKKGGFILVILGISTIVVIMWVIMPYYRNYAPAWTTGNIENISLFKDVMGKLIYLAKLLIPFGFLPIIYWKYGIIAGPAIGVNLLATDKNLYSTVFHYDDLTAPLLFISVILALHRVIASDFLTKYGKKRLFRGLALFWIAFLFVLLPASSMRILWKSIPSSTDLQILSELKKFDSMSEGKRIAVQSNIGPLFQRDKLQWYIQIKGKPCGMVSHIYSIRNVPVEYVVLVPQLGHYGINDMKLCLKDLSMNSQARKVPGFEHLVVYEKINKIKPAN
ncbi:MAG: DUF2079 domain-containing protein [SAR324 cluster bacterium]